MRVADPKFKLHDYGQEDVEFFVHNEEVGGNPQYWGYCSATNAYCFMRETGGVYAYVMGRFGDTHTYASYASAWSARAAMTYLPIAEAYEGVIW